MKKVAIIDYGAGNLMNVKNALDSSGLDGIITKEKQVIDDAHAIILPGVGAFRDAMEKMNRSGLRDVIDKNVRSGKIFQGICLGMQMLFDASQEDGYTEGFGYIPGQVVKMEPPKPLKIPHMGWNELVLAKDDPFLEGIRPGDYVYFVHSYKADPAFFDRDVLAYADYAGPVPGVVRRGNVIGTQFHPEKSGKAGQIFIENLKKLIKES